MKKILLITFLAFAALGVATGKYEVTVVGILGASLAMTKKNTGYAMLTILPAVVTDVMGNEVPPMTRAQKKMFDYLRSLDYNPVTLQALKEGAIMWDHITYYIRYIITGLNGRQKIVGPATIRIVGTTNIWNTGQLPQYYNFCYDRVEVAYANTTVNLDTVANISGYSSVLGSMPGGLRNGELIVSLAKNIQMETPITDFGSKAAVTGGSALDFDGGELQDPNIIKEAQTWEVELNLPQAIPSATNNTYAAEVLFKGIQARLRG